jgi:ATP-dependent helicase/nuclease subunit A
MILLNEFARKQNLASDPAASVYVSASAGTGKTKILVDRYLRLMLAGTKPSAILAVTFTNAAAKEMVSRIVAKAALWQNLSSAELRDELHKIGEDEGKLKLAKSLYKTLIAELANLKVQTLHSFANNILQAAYASRLKSFEIIHPKTYNLYLSQAVNEYLSKSGVELLDFYDQWQLEDIARNILAKKHSILSILRQTKPRDAMDIAALKASFFNNYQELSAIAELKEAFAFKDFAAIKIFFLTKDNKPRAKLVKANTHSHLVESLKQAQDEVLAILDMINDEVVYNYSLAIKNLCKFCYLYIDEQKKKESKFEYDDLLLELSAMLTDNPSLLRLLDYKIDHILVDEAQDLSPLQWQIVLKVSEEFFSGFGQIISSQFTHSKAPTRRFLFRLSSCLAKRSSLPKSSGGKLSFRIPFVVCLIYCRSLIAFLTLKM